LLSTFKRFPRLIGAGRLCSPLTNGMPRNSPSRAQPPPHRGMGSKAGANARTPHGRAESIPGCRSSGRGYRPISAAEGLYAPQMDPESGNPVSIRSQAASSRRRIARYVRARKSVRVRMRRFPVFGLGYSSSSKLVRGSRRYLLSQNSRAAGPPQQPEGGVPIPEQGNIPVKPVTQPPP
jgi:hypothetical protein